MIGSPLLFLMVLSAPLRVVSGFGEGGEHAHRPLDASLLRRGRNLGTVYPSCATNADCDDTKVHTLDTCVSGTCAHSCIIDTNACTTQSLGVNSCEPQVLVCDDQNVHTNDSCDSTSGCVYTCKIDTDACTTQSLGVNSCAPQALVCDDNNADTVDTCDSTKGCVHTCDDGNACTVDTWDNVNKKCVFETKVCNDNNLSTLDVCVPGPSGGCKFLDFSGMDLDDFDTYYDSNVATLPEDTIFYEDGTDLSEAKIAAILNWINKQVVLTKTPYCYKQSYGRGAGVVLSTCPSSKEKIGALCYSPCQSGYSRQGTFDCQQECKTGWQDDGLFCRKAEYGRGGGYPWQFGDPLNDSGMFRRCETDHGSGNCEKYGLIVYPKCASGYSAFGCCICRPPVPDCASQGYASPGLDLSCPVKIVPGDPTPLICASGLEQNGALCYPYCKEGFTGISPVCWQVCPSNTVDCGVGCAQSTEICVEETVDMVLAPLLMAVNLATLGVSSGATSAAKAVTVGSKVVACSTKPGFAMAKMAKAMKAVAPTVKKLSKVYDRASNAYTVAEFAVEVYGASQTYSNVFTQNFADMTSEEINSTLDAKLSAKDARYIKSLWASITFQEISDAENWEIAQTALELGSIFDPTGIVGVVAAYAKPICLDVVPFPDLVTLNSPPVAICENLEINADLESECTGAVPADLVGAKSTDADANDYLTYSLSGGPFTIKDSPHSVTLTVKDRDSASSTCTATITVTDITEAVVTCPSAIFQGTDTGKCTSVVTYSDPNVIDNCQQSSTLELTGGFKSGSVFPLGATQNTYQVTTIPGGALSFCNFDVTVYDDEPPIISCDGLAKTLNTEPGLCTASYSYTEPVGTDNCEEEELFTVQTTGSIQAQGQPFPLDTTTNTYEVYDAAGNIGTCSFDVVVVDKELPVVSCAEYIVVQINTPFDIFRGVSDNCDAAPKVSNSVFSVATPGVYLNAFKIDATDFKGNVGTCSLPMLVVFDPSAGFVTGGGWIMSPVGAYALDESLVGKANFGFVSKYKKGQTIPDGNTHFAFSAAGMTFQSTAYEWLVVTGSKCAKYKGTGALNGIAGYGFILTACDVAEPGSGFDTFRIQIWKTLDNSIVYDNKRGTPDDSYAGTTINGNIQVHIPKK